MLRGGTTTTGVRPQMRADTRSVAHTLAPAKVNLALFIGAERADGFHEVATLFQAISLADEVRVERDSAAGAPDRGSRIRLVVAGADLGPEEDNLAWRAAAAFLEETGLDGRIAIDLRKSIPAGAGLGGGSSDAAAVLRCLAALTGLDQPSLLTDIASGLGSDVPFFLGPSATAIGRGRGEVIQAVDPLPERPIAVALPPVHVATGPAYRALAASRKGSVPPSLPSLDQDVSWAELVGGRMANDFEETVAAHHPPVATSLSAMRTAGAEIAMLSGSGAASFSLFESGVDAAAVEVWCAKVSASLGWPVVPCTTLRRIPDVSVQ